MIQFYIKKLIKGVKKDINEFIHIFKIYDYILIYPIIGFFLIGWLGAFLYGGSYQLDIELNNTTYMIYMLYGILSDREIKGIFGDYENELPANSSIYVVTIFGINLLVLIICRIHS